jgi:transcriptional regulator GlxA family with amidase domain
LKVGRAVELIRRGPRPGLCSLTDVAAAVGFYDGAQFSRMFRAQLGLPPSAFAATVDRRWGRRGLVAP